MNEPTQSDTLRTDEYFKRRNDASNIWLTDDLAFCRQLERELNQAWEECERLRQLVPTTAQHMVYHSLLTKYKALEKELNQWEECADSLVVALNDVNDQNEGMLVWDDKVGGAIAHYNQLKQGEGK